MNINVCIPAFYPDEKLAAIIEKLNIQSVNVQRICIVNTDEAGFKAEHKKACDDSKIPVTLKHIGKEEFDHGKTRNLLASLTDPDCEIMIFMTQDAIPCDDELVSKLTEPFSDEKTGASYARQLAGDKSSLAERFTRGFNYPDEDKVKAEKDIETLGIKAFFCSNVCAAYRKSVFDSLGGFVDRAIFNEDMVYANKLIKSGYEIYYASKAKVIHTHEYNGVKQFKRNFDLAVSQKMNPDVFEGISSEAEGIKYIKAAFIYFCKNKRPFAIIPFGINCVCKYAGFRLGKKYDTLPMKKVLKYSMNPAFFEITEK